jgi:hypothetical protein
VPLARLTVLAGVRGETHLLIFCVPMANLDGWQMRCGALQQWFNLSGPAAEEALYDAEAMRRCAGLELTEDTRYMPKSL